MAKARVISKATTAKVKKLVEATPVTHVFEDQPRMLLSELLPGERYASQRAMVIERGEVKTEKATLKIVTRPSGKDHEVIAMAAVSRDPGISYDYINLIQDFAKTSRNRAQTIDLLWRIYESEGLVNNSINKVAAILSGGGEFKVRDAKKGKKKGTVEELQSVLDYWVRNVNSAADNAVITGSRGLASIVHQGTRQALVEGDWFGREVWVKANLPNVGNYSLPMNVQTISASQMDPIEDIAVLGAELYYWIPPSQLLQQLNSPENKEVKVILKKLLSNDVIKQLNRDQKVLLDPSLLMHVKHRGKDTEVFGESFITPAIPDIAYKRSVDQLDLATMQNLINRLTIVMVGSDDPSSPYSKTDVASARAALLQQFFEEPGPNMTIIWAGRDIDVKDIGAHNKVLDLDNRHKIAENKIKSSLGVPEALLSGTTSDGKASGFAAIMSAGAELEELQNSFAMAITSLGERIALDNGFDSIDIVFQFSKSLLIDKVEEQNQTRLDYAAGVCTIRDLLLSRGKDPDAVFLQKCVERGLDPATTTWEVAFMPPQGMAGQAQSPSGPSGTVPTPGGPTPPGGPGAGRQPNNQQGQPAQPPVPQNTPIENK